ncbi:MAG: ExbD/TolR family protein [Gammaproteobacteria bacterium]|nr:ExbD/TolR family protein [Gammaproteobacteria bacterium]MYF52908.1 ExbD/TolR family protein [Gammaproteobacteria bacterium]MYK43398.1 ExbD/TolR family protein [Gammaproteobacteria bacterium]
MTSRRKPMSEINLVPLIDVMLVLLIVSMVTVPLLTQGIDVDLPQQSSEPIEDADKNPLVVTIRVDERIYLNVGVSDIFDEDSFVTKEELQSNASKVISARPLVPVFLRADQNLPYGRIIEIMNILQDAGAKDVGLITEPPEV